MVSKNKYGKSIIRGLLKHRIWGLKLNESSLQTITYGCINKRAAGFGRTKEM